MLRMLKDLLAIMRADPAICREIPFTRLLLKKTFGWLLLTEVIWVAQMYPVRFFFDELNLPEPSLLKLLLISSGMTAIYLIGSEGKRQMDNHRNDTFWRLWYIWWGYGHRQELRLSTDWHIKHSTGEKESMVSKNIERFENLVDQFMFDTLPVTMRILITTGVLFFLDWRYGVFAVATVIVYGVMLLHNEKRLEPLRKSFIDDIKPIERFGTEITANWRTIKAIGREEEFADQNDAMLLSFWEAEAVRGRTYHDCAAMQDRVLIASRGLLYVLIGYIAIRHGSSIGTVVLATAWMETAYSNLWRFSEFQRQLNRGLEAFRELVTIMQLPPTVQQSATPKWPETIEGAVSFRELAFTYPEGNSPAIEGVDLDVPPCTSVALVGSSGCGKTTLMSLLQREYDPTEGSILIDGTDLRTLDYGRYRREIVGVVSQTVELFDGSIMDNIRVTKPEATIEEVVEVAKLAHAHEFILGTECGYDTMIGEDGVRLSGGQRQRIAIARALLRRPAILIMDEATSALDAISQQRIQEAIDQLIAERRCTIFIIAHRFSTIMRADMVAVLDGGRIAELGTHEELARMNGLYMRLRTMERQGLLD